MQLVVASELEFSSLVFVGVGEVDCRGEFSDCALEFGVRCYV